MDSPEPSKNNDSGSSSASALNNVNSNDPLSESPQVQESPFLRYVSTLSPITIKASHAGQGFLGLNSPPLVFKSPRISHRETQFVGRPQGTQSLGGKISQSGNGGNCLGEAPADSGKSNSQQPLPEGCITDTQKDFDSKNDANTQNNSSSSSIEQYFVDPGDIDQMYSADQGVEQSTDAAETSLSDPTQSKKNILKFDRKDGPGDKAEESLPLSDDSNKVHQEKPAYGKEPEKMEGEKNDVEWASQDPTNLESNLAADVFEKQYSHDPLPQDVKGCEDYHEMVSTSHVTSENILQDGSETLQTLSDVADVALLGKWVSRRCLQFGEAASKALVRNKSHVKESATSSEMKMVKVFEPSTFSFPQQCSGNFPVTDPKLSHVKQNATSSEMKMVKLSEPITSLFPQGGSGNFLVTGPTPSGIGLHLNSIINAMPTGQVATTGVRLSDGSQGMKPTSSIRLQRMENVKRCILLSNADGKSLVDTRNESHGFDASVATDSFVSESPGMTEPSHLYSARTHDKRKLNPIDAGNSEELNQPPSECKKKKKTLSTADGNGCKGCRCKKSKCLKLYCDCFALGIYCTNRCACQGCLNRPEYADTVCETKQQIESRDPIAFAPKIVQPNTDNKEDINLTTPASARHKRGCNCKRSMCLKKYCECYQANVGCSSGCRCEGCKNVYGKKEDCVPLEQHALSKERVNSVVEKRSDSSFHSKLEMVAREMGYDHSPITSSLQCSDQGMEASKSRVISGNYLPSPTPVVNMFLPHHANYSKSSENSRSNQSFLEADEMSETAPYDLQNNCNNVNMMDQSSPSNSVAILLQLTALSNPEPLSGSPPLSSGANEWTNVSQPRFSHESIRQIPGSSLRWRSSPVTPSTRVGEAQYLQCPESDIRLYDIVENETPDILQEASTPMTSVKVNSPTQKRVSPPQRRHYGIESSSSGGLRSGRKFILKAVPSFPPLSPCVDSKGNGIEDLGNSENK